MMEESVPLAAHWTLNTVLQPYFKAASIILAAGLALGVLANVFSWNDAMVPLQGWPLRICGTVVGVIAAGAALFLWLSMWWYWWQVDRRKRGMSVFWLIALSMGNWVGATVYYFFVFRRHHRETVCGNPF
jgi:peptidoglycan biosynthesis protein MviN/MurJ (putative lipid II flippase)